MAKPKNSNYKFQRRDRKQDKRKKPTAHGGSLKKVYPDAVRKRLREKVEDE